MASKVDQLLLRFETVINEPWAMSLSLGERIWFLVYDPTEQRKVDFRISDFEGATRRAGKEWHLVSLKPCFPTWMAANEYRDAYFEDPESLVDQLEGEFKQYVINYLNKAIAVLGDADNLLVAIRDVSALFGFGRLSEILNSLNPDFKGRILIFFPGEFEKNHYRLLDARDGWSYLARPITI